MRVREWRSVIHTVATFSRATQTLVPVSTRWRGMLPSVKKVLAPIGEPELLMATRSHYDAREWTTDKDRPSWTC